MFAILFTLDFLIRWYASDNRYVRAPRCSAYQALVAARPHSLALCVRVPQVHVPVHDACPSGHSHDNSGVCLTRRGTTARALAAWRRLTVRRAVVVLPCSYVEFALSQGTPAFIFVRFVRILRVVRTFQRGSYRLSGAVVRPGGDGVAERQHARAHQARTVSAACTALHRQTVTLVMSLLAMVFVFASLVYTAESHW